MSYSFSANGKTKQDALQDATNKFDAMVVSQPVHARDREAALRNVQMHIDLVAEPADNEQIVISMNGSIIVQNPTTGPERITHASSGCSVYVSTVHV